MKNMKKIISLTMAFAIILTLVGCENAAPAMNAGGEENIEKEIPESMDASDVADMLESGMTVDEVIDRVEEVKSGESATTDKPAEVSPTQATASTPAPTAKPTPEPTATHEPMPTPHVHSYKVESSTDATCSVEGSVVKVCECGERQTETVPATGQHNWEAVYQTITHPSTGHVEVTEVQVQVGTTTRSEYACAVCGERFDSPAAKSEHCLNSEDRDHAMARTIVYDYSEPVYEMQTQSQWVVDTPEYTTQELVGQKCTVCGATK